MKPALIYRPVGEYSHYDICRFCYSDKLAAFINLRHVPLAGGFLKNQKSFAKEKFYPLVLSFCQNCFLVQSNNVINQNLLFKDYFYHSSTIKTLVAHFEKTVKEFSKQAGNTNEKLIVEIGCNDGAFIREALRHGFKALGVDPAGNIVNPLIKEGLPVINEYFTSKTARKILKKHGKADIIYSSNTLAHIEDMHDVFRGIKNLLKKEGMLVFENHYLGNLIKEMQYDMIYHEHQYYYSLCAIVNFLKQHDMEVFSAKFIPVHAGSIRVYIQNKNGTRKIENTVLKIIKKEQEDSLTSKRAFSNFGKNILKTRRDLIKLLCKIKKQGKKIAGYGASGRGTIIMNYCGIDNKYMDYVIDDAPAKQGAYTPGTHLQIVSSKILNSKNRPDYVVLFAWSFSEEIKGKNKKYLENGGKFIVPLPKVKIIS